MTRIRASTRSRCWAASSPACSSSTQSWRAGRQSHYGRPCIHSSTIAGGTQLSAYPGTCAVGIERCLVPEETVAQSHAELEAVIARAAALEPRLKVDLEMVVGREAMSLARSERVVTELAAAVARRLRTAPTIRGDMGWMDSGILVGGGLPCVAFGPTGAGEHTAAEWVDLESVRTCASALADTARSFCSVQDHAERDH
jgi:acetylornithine deacetylase